MGALVLTLLVACSAETGPDPKQQFEELARMLQGGELVRLYQSSLPESYRADLDSVLRLVPQLVEQADYERGREIVRAVGKQLAALIATTPLAEEEAWSLLAGKLADLPALVGLGGWDEFRDISAERILRALEEGGVSELIRTGALRKTLAEITVELVDRKRDWARLVLTVTAEDGNARGERFDVVRVGEHWVRDEWVVDWPEVMERGRRSLGTLLDLKQRNPTAYRAELDAVLARASRPGFVAEDVLPFVGQQLLGGATPPVE